MNRYPIYVPTRGRWQPASALTIRFLLRDGTPFRAVVTPSEVERYEPLVGAGRLLVLPSDDLILLDARNWIRDHAESEGHARHWQLDDNIRHLRRWYRGRRIPCAAGPALAAVEDFVDRYTNIAVAGLNYTMFAVRGQPAVVRNVHVYSCTLINHAWPGRWRLVYNDDTDLCLQALADGWCTALVNTFLAYKVRTGAIGGGNTDGLYRGDGRLTMARQLERVWPGVVTVNRRYGRPQHVVNWRKFDTPLRLRDDVNLAALAETRNEYGLGLEAVKEVRAGSLRDLQETYRG
jgi:hypothetical protein